MRQLSNMELLQVNGAFKLHFNLIQAVFAVAGVTLLNPIMGGIMIGGLIATQGTGNLVDMWVDEFGNVQSKPR